MRKLPDDRYKGVSYRPDIKTSRLFVAIFPPESYMQFFKEVLRQFDKQKRNLRNIPVDQIHLTVKFIGSEVTDTSRDQILENLQRYQGDYPKPEISLGKVQFGFHYQADPRVIMVTVNPNKAFDNLTDVVHNNIKELGLRDTIRWKEKGNKNSHITLSRIRDKGSRSMGRDVQEIAKKLDMFMPEPFVPEYIELMESKFTKQGIVYKKLGKIKL